MSNELPTVRTGQGSTRLSRSEFEHRYRAQFADPAFDAPTPEVERLTTIAWEAYEDSRKSPHSRKAGPEFADPEHELPLEWLETRAAIKEAQQRFEDHGGKSRILLISASPRTDETCPGEMAKTFRVTTEVRECIERNSGFTVDFLDLSRINSEYGRQIHPCKACVSTAMPLCHWPCSCYPNHYMGQIHDWLTDMELAPAGAAAVFDRYIGYYEPYATSHEALDRDTAFMEEARSAALTLMDAVTEMRKGRKAPGDELESPRQK
ncbi:MAG: hypothetical protein B9S38_03170 [Verrucomicrobiia bacterium Tous-C4TDCM]|nr:MAG: hypothetical protein B9S38_03170 [Verrucomicrobiae bacterium Tous-C4TDCM]